MKLLYLYSRQKSILILLSLLPLLVIYRVTPVQAQSNISGIIQSDAGNSLPFASILLLSAQDSSLIKGEVSNEAGFYLLKNLKPGSYLLQASMMGYDKKYSASFTLAAQDEKIELPPFILKEASTELNTITIEAAKLLYEQQLDKLVVNVGSSITAAGSTALDILERSPGISLDRQNGVLSMNGKNGVQVMVNGKLTRLPLAAIIGMLEGMNAGKIEKIELITNPSAVYDAEGSAGMINIVLKKNTEYGTNGSFALTMGYGRHEKSAFSTNVNHRTKKANIYFDYSLLRNHRYQKLENYRLVDKQDYAIETITISERGGYFIPHNGRIGIDYTLTPKTTTGALISFFDNTYNSPISNRAQSLVDGQVVSLITQENKERHHTRQVLSNIYLKHQLKQNQEIQLDVDYLFYRNTHPNHFTTNYQYPLTGQQVREEMNIRKITPIHLIVGKADYSLKLGKESTMEAGLKAVDSRLSNTIAVDVAQEGVWQKDAELSGQYFLKETIGAAYINFNHQFNGKTKLQTGLRWEYTHTDLTNQVGLALVARRYGKLFPSIFLSRELSQKSSLQLSYSRRITRPTFFDIAPFLIFIDPDTYFTGNPSLRPALTDALQAGYKKGSMLLTFQYSHDKDAIAPFQVRYDPQRNKQITFADNMHSMHSYSLTVNLPVKLASWWQTENNISGIWQSIHTDYLGEEIQLRQGNGRFTTTQIFSLPHGFSLELSGFYQSRALSGVGQIPAFGSVNAGVQKKLTNSKGVFRLTITDIFWTMKWGFINNIPALNLHQRFLMSNEPRVVQLTYSRTFGNKNVKVSKARATGSEEERKRVGN